MASTLSRVKQAIEEIRRRDERLGEELLAKREELPRAAALEVAEAPSELPQVDPVLVAETIVLRTGRPVLTVLNNEPKLEFREAESEVWRERLTSAKDAIVPAIRAVGRVELQNHPRMDWVGTGWLVRPDIIVTNRHVAEIFGRNTGGQFAFRSGLAGRTLSASIDFLEEAGRTETLDFKVRKILHIEDEQGPDIAFLQVDPSGRGKLASPLQLASNGVSDDTTVAVIGYPARDSRIPDIELMLRIFGDVFDKKRLAPGQLTKVGSTSVEHDCSTLGGNSGSVVLGLDSGKAVGLHFAGRFLEANFAVPAAVIAERLKAMESGGARKPQRPAPRRRLFDAPSQDSGLPDGADVPTLSCTIPLRITVQIGPAQAAQAQDNAAQVTLVPTQAAADTGEDSFDSDEAAIITEARPEDYLDRKGYQSNFLGHGFEVPLPKIQRGTSDILKFQFDDKSQSELRYEHYSVVMNARRRLCFFSAVNIDGAKSKRTKRPSWKFDPRIPEKSQIKGECYGNEPKFSRGHMTRREDPAWGSSANLGNSDSMHVTNSVPQMQPFNAGIWLGLEDYALENAREDDMKITVITGPVFRDDDPVMFGVKIPITFWKVIAFLHDETGRLSATAYSISQEDFIGEEEKVFGAYETFQRSLKWVERQAGISFGSLTPHDLFESVEEAMPTPLTRLSQIRF